MQLASTQENIASGPPIMCKNRRKQRVSLDDRLGGVTRRQKAEGSGSIHELWCEHRRLQYKLRTIRHLVRARIEQVDDLLLRAKVARAGLRFRFAHGGRPELNRLYGGLEVRDPVWHKAMESYIAIDLIPAPSLAPLDVLRDANGLIVQNSSLVHGESGSIETSWVGLASGAFYPLNQKYVPLGQGLEQNFEEWRNSFRKRSPSPEPEKDPAEDIGLEWEQVQKLPGSVRYEWYLRPGGFLWYPTPWLLQAWKEGKYLAGKEKAAKLLLAQNRGR